MLRRTLHQEIRGRLGGTADLGPDAGIARLQRAVLERRPIAADGGIEAVAAPWIDGVVDAVDPFGVGAEARLTREVERQMHAQPRRLRHGIDEMLERRAARKGEIDAAAEIGGRNGVLGNARDASAPAPAPRARRC